MAEEKAPSQLLMQKALLTLGANLDGNTDREELQELLEEEVFKACNYFMKRTFVPKLSQIKRRKLAELQRAGEALGLCEHVDLVESSFSYKESVTVWSAEVGIEKLFEMFHTHESVIKQNLANTHLPADGWNHYLAWEHLQLTFAMAFCESYEKLYGPQKADEKVKMSTSFDFNILRTELRNGSSIKPELHRFYSKMSKMRVD